MWFTHCFAVVVAFPLLLFPEGTLLSFFLLWIARSCHRFRWIEPREVGAYFKAKHGVECNPAEFAVTLDTLQTFAELLWTHFATHATVAMIDDSMYAYAIGGICELVDAPPLPGEMSCLGFEISTCMWTGLAGVIACCKMSCHRLQSMPRRRYGSIRWSWPDERVDVPQFPCDSQRIPSGVASGPAHEFKRFAKRVCRPLWAWNAVDRVLRVFYDCIGTAVGAGWTLITSLSVCVSPQVRAAISMETEMDAHVSRHWVTVMRV
jgi:hypothetical protein